MLYDGIIGYKFEEMVGEPGTYIDKARRIVTMPSEEANGLGTGSVSAFFDLVSGNSIAIIERIDNDDSLLDTQQKIDDFNKSQKVYVATCELSEDASYIDITATARNLYETINDALTD